MSHARTLHSIDFRQEMISGKPSARARAYDVAVEERWNRDTAAALWERSSTASVFNHPAWWEAAIDCFGQDRRILGVTVRDKGELCGYWPFWEKRMGAKDGFVRVLEPVGARLTDYVMPLVERYHDSTAMISVMMDALKGELSPGSMILWPKADHIGAADAGVVTCFPKTRYLVHRTIRRCPRMTLPDSYDALKLQWSRNHRSQLRRRVRRLREMGALTLHVAASREETLAGLETLMAMHRVNWNDRSGGSEFDNPANRKFIQAIAAGLPFELLHYSEVWLNDQPISCNFDFRLNDEILFYKGAFDIEYSRYSPGMVHISRVSEWAIANGIRTLDFMQGEEDYKYLWADGVRHTVSHAISPLEGFPVWGWNTKLRKLIIEYKV